VSRKQPGNDLELEMIEKRWLSAADGM